MYNFNTKAGFEKSWNLFIKSMRSRSQYVASYVLNDVS
jgi:hypothetical protein